MSDFMPSAKVHRAIPQHKQVQPEGNSGVANYFMDPDDLRKYEEGNFRGIATAAERGIPYPAVEPRVFKTPPANDDGRRSPEIKPTRELLELDIKRGLSNKQMATKYRLSESALSVRLKQLGLKSDRRRKPKSEAQKESGW